MAGLDVFLAGNTAATLIRSIYEPGSRGVLSPWAQEAGLEAISGKGLVAGDDTHSQYLSLDTAASSRAVVESVLREVPVPCNLLGDRTELLVGSAGKRISSTDVVSRVWSTAIPSGAFLPIADHINLCSPSLLFAQRAPDLGLIQAINYGNELCGKYSLDASEHGFNDHPAFVAPRTLAEFLACCRYGKGTKIARTALKWVAAGFRSPKESETYLLTCLPRAYGGYGVHARPEVNALIPVPPELWFLADVHAYEVDLLWRDEKAIVEYDGSDHDDPIQKVRDDTKTHVLEQLGYLVIRIPWQILRDPREFDRRMRMLGERLHQPVPPTTPEFERKRSALRKALFQPGLR